MKTSQQFFILYLVKSGLVYRTFKFRIHLKIKHFEGPFSNGQKFGFRMVDHLKTELSKWPL